MRTIDDCIHAMMKAAHSTHFTVIDRGVARDAVAHLKAAKIGTPIEVARKEYIGTPDSDYCDLCGGACEFSES